ncbi:hypothetical protein D6853_01610 [Butyrivibrio sp. X503]|uniref:murein hydrolase activator EnvC family protein n=1 Tax=Butyrivibrio sp. X503 TaxID=2364878 RepID=UPI000EA90028|nr:M23 family metallopeptidase [Butyrivibrio sp. X503]RKM58261.1 hypothetical protein D6853_01610 [Butyrivibrio sp. X503]
MSADMTKPRKHRHRRNYTFMVISGDSDGSTKRLHLDHFQTQVLAYTAFALVLILICYIIFSAMTITNLRSIQVDQKSQIQTLTEENVKLTASNETLGNEAQQLRAALNMRLENEQQSAEEAENNAIPSGFPLTGSANIDYAVDDVNSTNITKVDDRNSEEEGNPLVLFSAASGSNIIAAGTGTVQSVTSDAKFGNYVSIDHGNGYISIYRNSGTPIVSEGDEVDRGDILFVVDGNNTKLGYQIQKDDTYINPEELIEING